MTTRWIVDGRRKRSWREWRRESPPPWAILVIGGSPTPDSVTTKAASCYRLYGMHGLSVYTFRWASSQYTANRKIPHKAYHAKMLWRLRLRGLTARMTDEKNPGHATLMFQEQPSKEDAQRLIQTLGRRRTNKKPIPSRKRR